MTSVHDQATSVSVADTAKMVRVALKAAFPGVKFSVTSKRSIRVCWTDGPTAKQVEAVAGVFAGQTFDGSIDMASYSYHWVLPNGAVQLAHNPGSVGSGGRDASITNAKPHPAARLVYFLSSYIFFDRDYSPAFLHTQAAAVAPRYGHPVPIVHTNARTGHGEFEENTPWIDDECMRLSSVIRNHANTVSAYGV